MELMRHGGEVAALLARAPGQNLRMLDPRPLCRVRAVHGRVIATTTTHVLHEWRKAGDLHARWDERWQVHPITPGQWAGEELY